MAALRAAGAESPLLRRPPGAPDAIVLRQYVGAFFWYLTPIEPIVGLVAGIVMRPSVAVVVGIVVGVATVALGVFAEWAAGRTALGVDGSNVHYRRLMGWRGPVDLRQLVARSATVDRSPAAARRWCAWPTGRMASRSVAERTPVSTRQRRAAANPPRRRCPDAVHRLELPPAGDRALHRRVRGPGNNPRQYERPAAVRGGWTFVGSGFLRRLGVIAASNPS